jgi:hypothetical protein
MEYSLSYHGYIMLLVTMVATYSEGINTIIAWLNVVIVTMVTLLNVLYVTMLLLVECNLGYCLFFNKM